MKTIYSWSLIRKTDTSEEKIAVTVEELLDREFHVRSTGTKTDGKDTLSVSPISGEIQGSPYPTAEIAIDIAREVAQKQIQAGYRFADEDEGPPSHNGGFQTHVRTMPPRR